MLKGTHLSPDFSIERLAARTRDMSGSDLKELCRNAAMVPVREYLQKNGIDAEAVRRAQETVSILCIIEWPMHVN